MLASSVTNTKEKLFVVAVDSSLPQADEGHTTLSTFEAVLVKIQIEWKNVGNVNTLLTSISSTLRVDQNLTFATQDFTLADKPMPDLLKSSPLGQSFLGSGSQ